MQFGTVCIIGPGLIGGSIGLGLKKRNLAKTVIGVGHRAASIDSALKMQAIDRGVLNMETLFMTPILLYLPQRWIKLLIWRKESSPV